MKTKRVHKLLALLLALMMTFSLLPTVTWATEKEEEEYVFQGSGTETDPYLIGDYTALKALATKVNGGWDTDGLYFRQTADIDMSEDTVLSHGTELPERRSSRPGHRSRGRAEAGRVL